MNEIDAIDAMKDNENNKRIACQLTHINRSIYSTSVGFQYIKQYIRRMYNKEIFTHTIKSLIHSYRGHLYTFVSQKLLPPCVCMGTFLFPFSFYDRID